VDTREAQASSQLDAVQSYLLDQVPAALVATDLEGVITHWNDHAARLYGWTEAEAIGRRVEHLLVPPGDSELAGQIMSRLRAGETWKGEINVRRKDGGIVPAFVSNSPILDADGAAIGFVGVSVDLSERKRAERRLAAQYAVTTVLAEAPTLAEATPKILQAICESLDWQLGALWEVDVQAELIRCVDLWHAPGLAAARFEEHSRTTPMKRGVGLPGRVWNLGEPAWITDVVTDANFPRAGSAARDDLHGAFGFPIRIGTRVLGVIEFFNSEIQEPDQNLLAMMSSVGSQIGQYMERKRVEEERARLFAMEREARTQAEAATERLAFLAKAGEILGASLDYYRTLSDLANLAVPRLADWCSIDVVAEDGSIRQVVVAHVDPARVKMAKRLRKRYPLDSAQPRGVPNVIQTGRSELYPEITEDLMASAARDEEHLRIMRELDLRSVMVVPLATRRGVLGALTLVSAESGRRFGPVDLSLAEDLARLAGMAVENARLYQERSRVAATLQRSLLPPELPQIPGVAVAARYRAAAEGLEVGGDFYDLFPTGGGLWVAVIGDVCGKGAEAASVTALARYTLRAAAMHERKPSAVLRQLNEAILRQDGEQRFCTVCYLRIRPDAANRRARLTVSCGGHPRPLVLRSDGTVDRVGAPGTLLGVFPDPDLSDRAVDLGPGDSIIAYTDGVTEGRNRAHSFGEERLEALLGSMVGMSAAGIAEKVERAVEEFRTDRPRDDLAVVVLRVLP
jgi:PAS domain S-box-containing protein